MDHGELGINPLGHTTRESQTGLITKVFLDSSIAYCIFYSIGNSKRSAEACCRFSFFLRYFFSRWLHLLNQKSSFHKSFLLIFMHH